jgi:N-acetylglucosaminyldiphosphoundecaprenol N-acetyl-beta-D-mannosaminyltransferase
MDRTETPAGDVHRLNIVGTAIGVLNLDSAVDLLAGWLREERTGRYVCVTGVHGVMEGLRDEGIRRIHNRAAVCVPDGMPLTWVGRLRGHRAMDRVYGPDLMLRLHALAARRGWANYYYGGSEGVAADLARRMAERFPGLRVAGASAPPFRPLTPAELDAAVAAICRARPDLLWIGLSTPKQEQLMATLSPRVNAKLMIGVGAAFNFHTGRVRQAPRWMQRAGLEWFFRLCMEPRRLTSRYVRNNPAFLLHVLLQLSGLRKYPLSDGPMTNDQ